MPEHTPTSLQPGPSYDQSPPTVQEALLRNPGNPLAQLPLELVYTIFSMLPLPDRIRVALVCKLWRLVALDYAPLWADIQDVGPFAVHNLLARSQRAPVTLVMTSLHRDDLACISLSLADHMDHVAHVELRLAPGSNCTSETVRPLWTALRCPAPVLQVLRLEHSGERIQIEPPNLFDDCAPRLRVMQLTGFDLSAPCAVLESVTAFSGAASWDATPHADEAVMRPMAFASRCRDFFPGLSQLQLTGLPDYAVLKVDKFPKGLVALELSFHAWLDRTGDAKHLFNLLSAANFASMQTLVLESPPNGLVPRLIAADESIEWMLLEGIMYRPEGEVSQAYPDGACLKVLTTSMRSRSFRCCTNGSLDDILLNPLVFANLVDVVVGPHALYEAFSGSTVATMLMQATNLETLTIVLDYWPGFQPLGAPGWGGQVLSLRNLREVRISAPPNLATYPLQMEPYIVLYFFENVLRMGRRRLDTLALFGISFNLDNEIRAFQRQRLEATVAEHVVYYELDVMTMLGRGLPIDRNI
ncbi:hypothetical protein EXIGLDRAFT_693065 [Exidia glandulosa HHB12029]|uniref:F-box domain-containing protein n=1 Tax=Exidia glandulosa HHB12029 TaxID=1314781 RepID=A0A165HL70_EXIGL|nr:hypothetical protein EXIGLDRAFT_693065 [Exidia glandulosa HHB12029]